MLDCTHNQLTQIPEEVGNMSRLEQLYLRHNKLIHIPMLTHCQSLKVHIFSLFLNLIAFFMNKIGLLNYLWYHILFTRLVIDWLYLTANLVENVHLIQDVPIVHCRSYMLVTMLSEHSMSSI